MKHLITALESELQSLRHIQINLADRINQAECQLVQLKSQMAQAPLQENDPQWSEPVAEIAPAFTPAVTDTPVALAQDAAANRIVEPTHSPVTPAKPSLAESYATNANTAHSSAAKSVAATAISKETITLVTPKQVAVMVEEHAEINLAMSAETSRPEEGESLPRSMRKNAAEQASHEWLSALLGPIAKVTRQLKSFYDHYQQRGLGPVFLMTLAGIAALTLGFGYLLQYSWSNVFSDGMRIAVSVLFANSILAAGLWVYKKKPDMSEYGSGLVGLAIILNYLCAYFAGPYLGLIGSLTALGWLAFITLAGYGLAQKLETKVVAVIALLGGAFSPLLFGVEQHFPALYLPYLLLQAGFAWRVCQQLRWHGLLTLASLTHIASVEAFILLVDFHAQLQDWRSLLALLSINLLFLLYALTGIAKLRKHKFDQHLLSLPAAQLAFFILAMMQIDSWSGQILALNSVLFLGLFAYWRKRDWVKHICLAVAGVLAGFAALMLVSNEFQGVIWSLEGAMLLWLGLRHRYWVVRSEAYVLLLIGLLSTAYACVNSLFAPSGEVIKLLTIGSLAISAPWLNFAITLGIVRGCEWLLRRYSTSIDAAVINHVERRVTWLLAELLSVLLALFIYFSCYLWLPDYTLFMSALVIPLLFWRTIRQALPLTEVLAWLCFLPLITQGLLSVQEAGSWRFTQQDLLGQATRVGLFTLMWLTYRVYCRSLPHSSLLPVARGVNLFIYLAIPAYITIKVGKVAMEWVALAAWLSVAVALALDYWRKAKVLRIEALVLLSVAIILSLAQGVALSLWQGWAGLLIGAAGFAAIEHNIGRSRARLRVLAPLRGLLKLTPHYFTLVIAALFCYAWQWPQYLAISCWLAAMLVFALHAWLAHRWFRYQLLALVWLANVAMVVSLFAGQVQGWWSLGIGVVVFSALRLYLTHWRNWLFRHPPLTWLRKSVPYYFALLVAICVYVALKIPDALWFSLWGCAAFAFVLHVPIRHLLLRSLGMILVALASAFNLYLTFTNELNGVLGLGIGLAAILVYSYVYPSRQRYFTRFKPLAMAYPVKPYYMAITGLALTYYVTHWLAPAVLVAFACLWVDLSRWPLRGPIRDSWKVALAGVLTATLGLIVLHNMALHGSLREVLLLAAFDGIALVGLGWLVFYTPIQRALRAYYLSSLLLWHGMFIAAYLLTGYSLGAQVFAPFSSIALVVHGSWLMMLSLQMQRQRLIQLASALFAFVFIKVIFWDMAGFALVQKVVAFMAIGSVLLVVSYFYLKKKNKQLAQQPAPESLTELES